MSVFHFRVSVFRVLEKKKRVYSKTAPPSLFFFFPLTVKRERE